MKASNFLVAAFLLSAPIASGAQPSPKAPSPQFKLQMAKLNRTLREILLDVASDDQSPSKDTRRRLERNSKTLATLAHQVSVDKVKAADRDPTMLIVSGLLSQEAERAHQELKRGNADYAKSILKPITGYCIACHTRNDSGSSFAAAATDPVLKALRPASRAEYYASVRQFDRALEEFEPVISDANAPLARSLEWERAIRYSLAIAVRVKNDPELALAITERVLSAPKAPLFLRENAAKWKDSISDWKREAPRKAVTEDGLMAEAKRLVVKARQIQRHLADRSADVVYLRATSVLHELLQAAPSGRNSDEALLMLGDSYQVLRDLELWDFHEVYYLACIYKSPHSEAAKRCYLHYEESVHFAYTGSDGVSLPEDVKARLFELNHLAGPVAQEEQGAARE